MTHTFPLPFYLLSHSALLCSALLVIQQAPSLSLVLLDPEEASKKTEADAAINEQQVAVDRGYAAVAFELAGLCVRGVMGGAEESSKNTEANGAPASARSLSVSLDASLYLFLSGACGLPTLPESAVLCASFPVRVNVSKIGSDPTSMTSSISMADFASTLALAPTSKAMGLLMDCEGYRQRALSVLKGFLGNIRNTIPSILPFRPHDVTVRSDSSPAAASPATTTKITDCDEMKAEAPPFPSATGDLLQQLRPVDPSAGETESMQEYVTAYGAPATSQRLITSQISRRLQSAHRSLEQLHLHSALPSHSASRAIEEALLVCVELQDAALRLRNAALVAFNMTPSYCGWVYRSQGFLSNPSRATGRRRSAHAKEGIGGTGGGVRSWMVLVMGNLLFMSQPYAGAVDISLSLDDIVVADPDESEIASMPMPTSLAEKVVSLCFTLQ